MMAVGWLLGSCAEDDAVQQGDNVPIKLAVAVSEPSATPAVEGATRAASSTQNTELLSGQAVDVYIKNADGSDFLSGGNPLQCTVSGASGDLTAATSVAYPLDGSSVKMYAVHPRIASGDTHTVSADQTSNANYAASDLTYSKTATYAFSTSAQTLPMVHVMAQIVVNISLPAAWAGRAITDVNIHAKRGVVFNYPTGSSDDYSLGALSSDGTILINEGEAAVIPPQTITSGSTFITFRVAGVGQYTYALPSNTTFAPGHRYVYTITPKSATLSFSQTNRTRLLWSSSFTNPLTNTGNGQVIYTSSNTSVATVNPTTGEVTPVSYGTTTITASVVDGINHYYSIPTASYDLLVRYKKMNPLWYVAESNVKSYNSGTKVVTLEPKPIPDTPDWGYAYCWSDAMSYFAMQTSSYNTYWGSSTIRDGSTSFKYHLPVLKEWGGLVPSIGSYNIISSDFVTGGGLISTPVDCIIGYDSESKQGVQDWSYWSNYDGFNPNVRYAIRFLGTIYCSAWKYEITGTGLSGYLTITAKLIECIDVDDPTIGTTLNSYINNAPFWTSLNEEQGGFKRIFINSGYRTGNNNPNTGEGGTGYADYDNNHSYFWTATQSTNDNAYAPAFGYVNPNYLSRIINSNKKWGFSVRLFRSE